MLWKTGPFVLLALGAGLLSLGCGNDFSDAQVPDELPDFTQSEVAEQLGTARRFRGFRLYFAGRSVDGLRLTAVSRLTRSAPSGKAYPVVSFFYGKCKTPRDPDTGLADGGCGPPVVIQNSGLCAQPPPSKTERTGRLRGVQAYAVRPDHASLYTGRTSVTISASGANASSVADALRSLDGRFQSDKPLPPSPPGVVRGTLRCPG